METRAETLNPQREGKRTIDQEREWSACLSSYLGLSFAVFIGLLPRAQLSLMSSLRSQNRTLAVKLYQANESLRQMKVRLGEDAKANAKVVEIFASHRIGWLQEERRLRRQIDESAEEIAGLQERIADLDHSEADFRLVVDRLQREIDEKEEFIDFLSRNALQGERHGAEVGEGEMVFSRDGDGRVSKGEAGEWKDGNAKKAGRVPNEGFGGDCCCDLLISENVKVLKDFDAWRTRILDKVDRVPSESAEMEEGRVDIPKAGKLEQAIGLDSWRVQYLGNGRRNAPVDGERKELAGNTSGAGTISILEELNQWTARSYRKEGKIQQENARILGDYVPDFQNFGKIRPLERNPSKVGQFQVEDCGGGTGRDRNPFIYEKKSIGFEGSNMTSIGFLQKEGRIPVSSLGFSDSVFAERVIPLPKTERIAVSGGRESAEMELSKNVRSKVWDPREFTPAEIEINSNEERRIIPDADLLAARNRGTTGELKPSFPRTSLGLDETVLGNSPIERRILPESVFPTTSSAVTMNEFPVSSLEAGGPSPSKESIGQVSVFPATENVVECPVYSPGASFQGSSRGFESDQTATSKSKPWADLSWPQDYQPDSFGALHQMKHLVARRESPWKVDAESMGVSSKMKFLEQELLTLEQVGKGELAKVPTLMRKQAKRYQTLAGKIDDLCRRMQANDPYETTISSEYRTHRQTEFLLETFRLQQRAAETAQKLTAIHSELLGHRLSEEFSGPAKINTKRSLDAIKNNLKEIQRSLEIWLARIMGDIEARERESLSKKRTLHSMEVWVRPPSISNLMVTSRGDYA